MSTNPTTARVAAAICRAVAEPPDRNSPTDWPEAMLVTHIELENIINDTLYAERVNAQDAPVDMPAPAVALPAEPMAILRVYMTTHDMGQSLAPEPPFKFARVGALKAADDLPLGDYDLYLATPTAPVAQPAPATAYLCNAWGESDRPCVAIVHDLESVRRFLVDQWLGDENDRDASGESTLSNVMAEIDGRDWLDEGAWSGEFEIGGISVDQVFDVSHAIAVSHAPVSQPAPAVVEPVWYHAECDDPDRSAFYIEKSDAQTQVNDHGGYVTELFAGPLPHQIAEPATFHPMSTAPRDSTIVRLLVNFDDNALEDTTGPVQTIGHNNFDHDGEDRWQFAGWCWSHDCYTEGKGTPIGWLPFQMEPS